MHNTNPEPTTMHLQRYTSGAFVFTHCQKLVNFTASTRRIAGTTCPDCIERAESEGI